MLKISIILQNRFNPDGSSKACFAHKIFYLFYILRYIVTESISTDKAETTLHVLPRQGYYLIHSSQKSEILQVTALLCHYGDYAGCDVVHPLSEYKVEKE